MEMVRQGDFAASSTRFWKFLSNVPGDLRWTSRNMGCFAIDTIHVRYCPHVSSSIHFLA